MKIKLILRASLKKYLNNIDGIEFINIQNDMTIQNIIEMYNINPLDVGLIIINDTLASKDTVLKENDVVELFAMAKGG